jgi:hypothetical protein
LQRIELNYLSPRFHRRLMQLTAFDIEAGHPRKQSSVPCER